MPVILDISIRYRTFYVVFQDSSSTNFWNIITFKSWKHCWLFTPAYLGPPGLLTPQKVVRINTLLAYLDVDFWDGSPSQVAKEFMCQPNVVDIVKITLPLRKSVSYTIRGLINCVTIVKSFMGLKCWWIITPQQLHRYLLRHGGISMRKGAKNECGN